MTAKGKRLANHDLVRPEEVDDPRRPSDCNLSELSFLREKLRCFNLEVNAEALAALQHRLQGLEREGWQFDGADASFFLCVLKCLKRYRPWFDPASYCILARGSTTQGSGPPFVEEAVFVEASVKLHLEGKVIHTVREGNGPVNALDLALREALRPSYPRLAEMALTGCAVHVLKGKEGAAPRVRVMLHGYDSFHDQTWRTLAVSSDLLRAAWLALVDAFEFKKLLDDKENVFPSSRSAQRGLSPCATNLFRDKSGRNGGEGDSFHSCGVP